MINAPSSRRCLRAQYVIGQAVCDRAGTSNTKGDFSSKRRRRGPSRDPADPMIDRSKGVIAFGAVGSSSQRPTEFTDEHRNRAWRASLSMVVVRATVLKMHSNWLVKAMGPEPAHLLTASRFVGMAHVVSSRGLRRWRSGSPVPSGSPGGDSWFGAQLTDPSVCSQTVDHGG